MEAEQQNEKETSRCANCSASLSPNANYCHQCGQRSQEVAWRFRNFVQDFFEQYLAFDSKIVHTLKPFFLRPGRLTKDYIQGKRAQYVHPVRLYLFTSIVFFFLLSMMGDNFESPAKMAPETKQELDSLKSIEPLLPRVTPVPADKSRQRLSDTGNLDFKEKRIDSVSHSTEKTKNVIKIDLGSHLMNADTFLKLTYDLNLSPEEVVRRSAKKELSPIETILLQRTVRINRTEPEDIYQTIVRNFPLMMLILVPFFALLLKLAYFRRKNWLFLHHVIHSLHLHAFLYAMGILVLIIYLIPFFPEWIPIWVRNIALIFSLIYWWLSLRSVYGRSIIKTTLTFLFLVGLYLFLSLLSVTAEILLSLLFF